MLIQERKQLQGFITFLLFFIIMVVQILGYEQCILVGRNLVFKIIYFKQKKNRNLSRAKNASAYWISYSRCCVYEVRYSYVFIYEF